MVLKSKEALFVLLLGKKHLRCIQYHQLMILEINLISSKFNFYSALITDSTHPLLSPQR